jgi:hypothetical protein
MDKLGWSTTAHRRHKAAVSARKSQAQLDAETRRMRRGPHLDGHTLIVPSEWYNEEARSFWQSQGFYWRAEDKTWRRNTRRRANGRTYPPGAWLTAATRKFYEFWPNLRAPRGEALSGQAPSVNEDHYTGDWR